MDLSEKEYILQAIEESGLPIEWSDSPMPRSALDIMDLADEEDGYPRYDPKEYQGTLGCVILLDEDQGDLSDFWDLYNMIKLERSCPDPKTS